MQKKPSRGFSLIEIIVVVAIVALIVTLALPSINSALRDGREGRINANIQTLNQAADRARLAGQVGPGTYGSDKDAALGWYLDENLLRDTNIDLEGMYFYMGIWERSQFLTPESISEAMAPRVSSPEEDIQILLSNFGASSPEQLARWYGFASGPGDEAALFANYGVSNWDEFAQQFGYPDYNTFVNDNWGHDPGTDLVAQHFGYAGVTESDIQALADYMGYTSFQEWATTNYQQVVTPPITSSQIREIATMLPDISTETFSQVLQNLQTQEPTIGENFITLQNAFAQNLANGNLSNWETNETQNEYWEMLQTAMSQNTTEGSIMPQLDFSLIDLSGRNLTLANLTNSNITGNQLNGVASLYIANLSNMDLTGFNPAGIDIRRANLSGTNITAEQLNAALAVSNQAILQTNLSGVPLTGLNLNGADVYGVNFQGTGVTGTQLNGVTRLNLTNLTGLDLTGLSFAGKTVGGINLEGTNVTSAQLNQMPSYLQGANLTGINLSGWNTTGRSIDNVNLTGATISVAQLNGMTSIRSVNGLQGRDLTGLVTTNEMIHGTNFSNTTGLTAAMIASSFSIQNINLSGTGITKAALDAALVAAGRNPNGGNHNTNTITF